MSSSTSELFPPELDTGDSTPVMALASWCLSSSVVVSCGAEEAMVDRQVIAFVVMAERSTLYYRSIPTQWE
jgi:hypothetical protein